MQLQIFAVGKLKESYFQQAEAEYRKRLRPYCQLDVSEFKTDGAMLAAVPSDAAVYALDERGELLSSVQFANDMLGKEQLFGRGRPVVFAIGGADGHTEAMRKRAQGLIAFGRLTVAHRLMRVVLIEQIYRGFRILRGEPYHRE